MNLDPVTFVLALALGLAVGAAVSWPIAGQRARA